MPFESDFYLDKRCITKVKVSVRNNSPQSACETELFPKLPGRSIGSGWFKEDCHAAPGQFPPFVVTHSVVTHSVVTHTWVTHTGVTHARSPHAGLSHFFCRCLGAEGCRQHRRHRERPDRSDCGPRQGHG